MGNEEVRRRARMREKLIENRLMIVRGFGYIGSMFKEPMVTRKMRTEVTGLCCCG